MTKKEVLELLRDILMDSCGIVFNDQYGDSQVVDWAQALDKINERLRELDE